MSTIVTLHDLATAKPEHPVPRPGNVVSLRYPPRSGDVDVRVDTDAFGYARFTVAIDASEASRLVAAARRAATRTGGEVSDEAVALLVKQGLMGRAAVRTGIFPFLRASFDGARPEANEPFEFSATVLLRPVGELSSYEPVRVAFPHQPAIEGEQVDRRLSDMLGGSVAWQMAPDDMSGRIEDLRERIRRQLEEEGQREQRSRLMQACSEALGERLVVGPPTRYVEALRDELANRYASAVEASGQRWDAYVATPGFDIGAFKEQMTREAEASLRRGMALDAAARHFAIELDEDDLFDCLTAMAPGHELEAIRALWDNGQVAQFLETALRAKTSDFIADRAIDSSIAER